MIISLLKGKLEDKKFVYVYVNSRLKDKLFEINTKYGLRLYKSFTINNFKPMRINKAVRRVAQHYGGN